MNYHLEPCHYHELHWTTIFYRLCWWSMSWHDDFRIWLPKFGERIVSSHDFLLVLGWYMGQHQGQNMIYCFWLHRVYNVLPICKQMNMPVWRNCMWLKTVNITSTFRFQAVKMVSYNINLIDYPFSMHKFCTGCNTLKHQQIRDYSTPIFLQIKRIHLLNGSLWIQ